jgi:hypothetical protein
MTGTGDKPELVAEGDSSRARAVMSNGKKSNCRSRIPFSRSGYPVEPTVLFTLQIE